MKGVDKLESLRSRWRNRGELNRLQDICIVTIRRVCGQSSPRDRTCVRMSRSVFWDCSSAAK